MTRVCYSPQRTAIVLFFLSHLCFTFKTIKLERVDAAKKLDQCLGYKNYRQIIFLMNYKCQSNQYLAFLLHGYPVCFKLFDIGLAG